MKLKELLEQLEEKHKHKVKNSSPTESKKEGSELGDTVAYRVHCDKTDEELIFADLGTYDVNDDYLEEDILNFEVTSIYEYGKTPEDSFYGLGDSIFRRGYSIEARAVK